MAIAASKDLKIENLDISSAFLNGDINRELYMEIPEGLSLVYSGDLARKCLKLKKGLYGLKQAAHIFHEKMCLVAKESKFIQCKTDPCVFHSFDSGICLMAIWVDDIITFSSPQSRGRESLLKSLKKNGIAFTDKGETTQFLGTRIEKNNGLIWIGQTAYIDGKIKEFKLEHVKDQVIPVAPGCVPRHRCHCIRTYVEAFSTRCDGLAETLDLVWDKDVDIWLITIKNTLHGSNVSWPT